MRRFADTRVASLFKSYPPALRARLMALRDLVLDTAAQTTGVDEVLNPSLVFIKRCEAMALNPPSQGWNGVYVMQTK